MSTPATPALRNLVLCSTSLMLFCLAFLPINSLMAQAPGGGFSGANPQITGSISGRVVDSLTGKPVEFATLLLKRARPATPPAGAADQDAMIITRLTERLGRAPDSTEIAQAKARMQERFGNGAPGAPNGARPGAASEQVDGTITDLDGNFKFSEVKLGDYSLELSFIGYDTRSVGGLQLTGKSPDLAIGDVRLSVAAETLNEVVVTGDASLIENRVDKIVYNASQDVANQGGDASDILRRVPLLSVDLEGSVSLRGSENVQILINGRPSSMFASSVADALRAMPAEEIERVEVITSPGARYQGEGTAGIINIITKKGGLKGLTGGIRSSVGTVSNNVDGNLSYSRGRFGVSGGLNSRFSWLRPTSTYFERIPLGGPTDERLVQVGDGNSRWIGLGGNVAAYYDLNAYNAFNLSFRTRGRSQTSDFDIQSQQFIDGEVPADGEYNRLTQNFDDAFNFDLTADYKRRFTQENHELNFALQWSHELNDRDYNLEQTVSSFSQFVDEIALNEGRNNEYTVQLDYQKPWRGDKTMFETGALVVLRDLGSTFDYSNRLSPDQNYAFDDVRSNALRYDQDVAAAYVSGRNSFGERWQAIAGLRFEHTAIGGALRDPEPATSSFANDYSNLLPSASVQYTFSPGRTLRFGYSRRIQRPGLRFVNPFVDESDRRDISKGNPALRPELTDQVELAGNTRIGSGFLNLSVFYRYTQDEISSLLTVENGLGTTTFINLGTSRGYGSNLFASWRFGERLQLRGGANASRIALQGSGLNETLSREVWVADLNGSLTLELPGKFVIESFGFYRAPRQTIQGKLASFSIWSIGAEKKFMDDRWRVGLRVVEPFAKFKAFNDRLEGEDFLQISNRNILFRSFNLNLGYRFGQLSSNRTRERRSKINNNDVRQDGGGEF